MIDILYLTHNRREFTEASFACLIRNTDWEHVRRLVVYDDGSEDGTREVIERLLVHAVEHTPIRMTLLRAERDLGPVGIMQRHIADTDAAPVFAKIDNDVCVPPDWLHAMVDVLERNPAVELLGMEAGMAAVKGRDGALFSGYGFQPASNIGGVGLMRLSAFQSRPAMRADGRHGFTEWQHTHEPVRGWITPDLPVVLLDRLPFEPWVSLARGYVAEGWQRDWPKWDPVWMDWAWAWFNPVVEIADVPSATVGPFRFQYLADGDDPGTGKILLETDSGYVASTGLGVPRDEWDAFAEATS